MNNTIMIKAIISIVEKKRYLETNLFVKNDPLFQIFDVQFCFLINDVKSCVFTTKLSVESSTSIKDLDDVILNGLKQEIDLGNYHKL